MGCGRGPTSAISPEVAYVVAVLSADAEQGSARIVWRIQPHTSAPIPAQRRLGDGPWKEFGSLTAVGDGDLLLEDDSVQPGASYTYRLQLPAGATPVYAGEVLIEVPGS